VIECTLGGKPSWYVTSHPGQLSLAIPSWDGVATTGKSYEYTDTPRDALGSIYMVSWLKKQISATHMAQSTLTTYQFQRSIQNWFSTTFLIFHFYALIKPLHLVLLTLYRAIVDAGAAYDSLNLSYITLH